MKAITTGFAVTALAAAISGQAMAEAEITYAGEINVQTVIDLENDTRVMGIEDDTADGDQDHYELSVTTTVTNGPFSGTLYIEELTDSHFAADGGDTAVYVDDLMVTDGAISFGQIGDIVATDGLIETASDDDDADDLSYGVAGAMRYTDEEMGLKVQAEGDSAGNVFGLGASITSDIGMGTVSADVQYAEDGTGTALDMFFGVGAELMPTDELTVTAAFQSNVDTQYAVRADYAMDAMTAYGSYYEPSADNAVDDEVIMVGGTFTADMLTFSADYTMTMLADGGDEVAAGVAYANDNIAAYADITLGNFDAPTADDMILEVGASTTSEAGVEYAADYESQANTTSALTLSAAYSF